MKKGKKNLPGPQLLDLGRLRLLHLDEHLATLEEVPDGTYYFRSARNVRRVFKTASRPRIVFEKDRVAILSQ